MSQGKFKIAKTAPKSKKQQQYQHRTQVIKPKKPDQLKKYNFKKKQSSGLAAMTEKSLASKAGHLELLAGGRQKGDKPDATKKSN